MCRLSGSSMSWMNKHFVLQCAFLMPQQMKWSEKGINGTFGFDDPTTTVKYCIRWKIAVRCMRVPKYLDKICISMFRRSLAFTASQAVIAQFIRLRRLFSACSTYLSFDSCDGIITPPHHASNAKLEFIAHLRNVALNIISSQPHKCVYPQYIVWITKKEPVKVAKRIKYLFSLQFSWILRGILHYSALKHRPEQCSLSEHTSRHFDTRDWFRYLYYFHVDAWQLLIYLCTRRWKTIYSRSQPAKWPEIENKFPCIVLHH